MGAHEQMGTSAHLVEPKVVYWAGDCTTKQRKRQAAVHVKVVEAILLRGGLGAEIARKGEDRPGRRRRC